MENKETLFIIWTSGEKEVALKMVLMYGYNSLTKGWWDDITLVIWGPSAKLLLQDDELKQKVDKMKSAGVKLVACKACADSYGISSDLKKLGVEVKYIGSDLTSWIKGRENIITF